MITVQPNRYTAHPEEWHRFAQVLGFVPAFPPERGWSEWDAGGVLAVHQAGPDRAGRTDFHVRVDDLAVVEAQLEEAGIPFERSSPFDVGPMLSLVTGCADAVSVSGGARAADSGPLKVLPILYYMDTITGIGFGPEEYVDISEVIEIKKEMMRAHATQIKFVKEHHGVDFLDLIEISGRFRGYQCGARYAEGFVLGRGWNRVPTSRLLP